MITELVASECDQCGYISMIVSFNPAEVEEILEAKELDDVRELVMERWFATRRLLRRVRGDQILGRIPGNGHTKGRLNGGRVIGDRDGGGAPAEGRNVEPCP